MIGALRVKMPHPLLIFSHSDYIYLIQVVGKNLYFKTNSVDPDQLASEEDSWSGFKLFAKIGHIQVQQEQGLYLLINKCFI